MNTIVTFGVGIVTGAVLMKISGKGTEPEPELVYETPFSFNFYNDKIVEDIERAISRGDIKNFDRLLPKLKVTKPLRWAIGQKNPEMVKKMLDREIFEESFFDEASPEILKLAINYCEKKEYKNSVRRLTDRAEKLKISEKI